MLSPARRIFVVLFLVVVACDGSTGLGRRPLPEGEYRLWRMLVFEAPPPPAYPGGATCVLYHDGTILVGSDGAVRLARRFTTDPSSPAAHHDDTLAGEQRTIPGTSGVELRFTGWSDTAVFQTEPQRDVVYLRQHFPASAACGDTAVVLEYVRSAS